MVVISFTNIIVDDFQYKPNSPHIYFLTHMHADHYMGLSNGFSSPIFCSVITSKILLLRFPKVNVHPLMLY